MNNFFLLDIMLENEKMLYLSLFIVIVLGYFIFNKLNILSLFILAIFIGVKIAIHNYVDNYIDSNKKLISNIYKLYYLLYLFPLHYFPLHYFLFENHFYSLY